MSLSRKRIVLTLSVVATLAVGVGLFSYATNRPSYLASRAERIPKFFGISPSSIGADKPNFCLDEIHSQGRRSEDFGSAVYTFDVPCPHGFLSGELYRHPNSSVNDSTLVITVQREDIKGTLSVEFDTGKGVVTYEQIY